MAASTVPVSGEPTLSVFCNRTHCEINTFGEDVIQVQRDTPQSGPCEPGSIMFVVACTCFLTLFMATVTCLILLKLFRRHPYIDRTSRIRSSRDKEQFELSMHHSTQEASTAGPESMGLRHRSNRRSIFPSGFYDMIDSNEMEESNATYVPPDFANEAIMFLDSADGSTDSCESENEYVVKQAATRSRQGSPRYIDHPKVLAQYENLPDTNLTNSIRGAQTESHCSYPVVQHYNFDDSSIKAADDDTEAPDEGSLDVEIPLNENHLKRRSQILSKSKKSPLNQANLEPQPAELGYLCPTSLADGSTSGRTSDDPGYLCPVTDGAGRQVRDDGYLVPQHSDAGYMIPEPGTTGAAVRRKDQFHDYSCPPYKMDKVRTSHSDGDKTPNTSRHSRRYVKLKDRASGLQSGSQPEMRSPGMKGHGRACYSLVPAYVRTPNTQSRPDRDLRTNNKDKKPSDSDTSQNLRPEIKQVIRRVYILKKKEHSSNKRANSMLMNETGESQVANETRKKERPQSENPKLFSTAKFRNGLNESNVRASGASLPPTLEEQTTVEMLTGHMGAASRKDGRAVSPVTKSDQSDSGSREMSLVSSRKDTLSADPFMKRRSPNNLFRTSLTQHARGNSAIHERRSLPVYSTFKPPVSREQAEKSTDKIDIIKVTHLPTAENQDGVPVSEQREQPKDPTIYSDDPTKCPERHGSDSSLPESAGTVGAILSAVPSNPSMKDPPRITGVRRNVPAYVCMAGRASPTLAQTTAPAEHPTNDQSKTLSPGATFHASCLSRIPKANSMGSQSVPGTPRPRRLQSPTNGPQQSLEEEDDDLSTRTPPHQISLRDDIRNEGSGEFTQAQRKAQSLPGTPYLSARPQLNQIEPNYVNL